MENKFQKTLATAGGEGILAVIEGLPVTANGFFLTEAQMDAIDAALVDSDATAATLATTKTELTAANTAKTTAETALATANTRIATLEIKDGATPAVAHAPQDPAPVANDAKEFETSFDRERAQMEARFK